MGEPRWLSRPIVEVIHSELMAEHGGAYGLRAGGSELIDSALERPRNLHAYQSDSDLASLAASYLVGLTKNHGFLDGNKRVGFAAAAVFLRLNGFRLAASEIEAYEMVIGIVESRYSEAEAASWIRGHLTRIR